MTCDAVREPGAEEVHAREALGDRGPLGGGSESERDLTSTTEFFQQVARAAAEEAEKRILIHRLAELERRVTALEARPLPSPYRSNLTNVWANR